VVTDLLEDPRFWDDVAVLEEPADVPVLPDSERPAFDGDDDGYEYLDGAR
jgi:hypothetical protein